MHYFLLFLFVAAYAPRPADPPPNVLFCIADDQSWLHTSFAGAKEVSTPGFDFVAKNGVYFERAYCAASSCAPSRAAILSSQPIWRLREGALLFGGLPKDVPLFTDILRANGYTVAHTGKAYGPASLDASLYHSQPVGPAYDALETDAPEGVRRNDYAGNFNQFLAERDSKKPFFFWYGGYEPHRTYQYGIGQAHGKNLSRLAVPPTLPDVDTVRNDIADYLFEVEWFDSHLARMIEVLRAKGELDNTIIIVTSDNGMPFPGGKTTEYELGTHMPLAVYWGKKVKPGRRVKDYVSLSDIGVTLLDILGMKPAGAMVGKSFKQQLLSKKAGQIDPKRNRVFTALERHTYCRPDGLTYPIRSIHKDDWVLIHNFEPDRYPAGNPDFVTTFQGIYGDVDAGPTRTYMLNHQNGPDVKVLFAHSFGKRPAFELYDLEKDPFQQNNLALDKSYAGKVEELKADLFKYLRDTNDPLMRGESPWDDMPFYFTGYEKRYLLPRGQRDK